MSICHSSKCMHTCKNMYLYIRKPTKVTRRKENPQNNINGENPWRSIFTLRVKEYFWQEKELWDKFLEICGWVAGGQTPWGLSGMESTVWDVKVPVWKLRKSDFRALKVLFSVIRHLGSKNSDYLHSGTKLGKLKKNIS